MTNQRVIQEQVRKARTIEKARLISQTRRVRRSEANRNIWLVGSGNPKTPKKFYCVQWNEEIEGFMCDCPAFEFSSDNTCKHIYACSLYEGGLA